MSTPPIVQHRFKAFKKQAECCYYCESLMWLKDQKSFAKKHKISMSEAARFQCTAEHLLAQCEGGSNNESNIVAACRFCNMGRHARKKPPVPEKYRQLIQLKLNNGKWHPKAQYHLLPGH